MLVAVQPTAATNQRLLPDAYLFRHIWRPQKLAAVWRPPDPTARQYSLAWQDLIIDGAAVPDLSILRGKPYEIYYS